MTWLGGAWSRLVLVRSDQKINLQTQRMRANGEWASALWLQQHSESAYFWDTLYVFYSCTLSRRDKAPANSSPNRSAVSFPSILRTWNFAQMITIRFGLITRLALSVSSLHWVPTSLVWPMMFCTSVIKDWTWGQTKEIKHCQRHYGPRRWLL